MKYVIFLFFSVLLIFAGDDRVQLSSIFKTTYTKDLLELDKSEKVELEQIVQNNDIFNTSLLLANQYFDNIDIEQANQVFDEIVAQIKERINDKDDPNAIINIINKYLFEELQIKSESLGVVDEKLLDKILKNKKGDCVGLSLIYLALGEKLKLPLFAKIVPSHLYVCYDDSITKFNIETTLKGHSCSDSYYFYHYPYPEKHRIINKLNKREILAIYLTNLAAYKKNDNLDIEKKALYLFPNSAKIYCNIGISFSSRNRLKEANKYLLKAWAIDQTSWINSLEIANVFYKNQEYENAVEYYIKTIDLIWRSIKITSSYPVGLPNTETLNKLIDTIQNSQDISYNSLLGCGIGLFQQQNYEASKKYFARALELYPEELGTHTYYSITNLHLGNYELARKHAQIEYGQIVRVKQGSPMYFINKISECYFFLGISQLMLKNYESSLTNINKAMEISGPERKYFLKLAEIYKLTDKKDEAIKYYKDALELNPLDGFVQKKLSELSTEESNKKQ